MQRKHILIFSLLFVHLVFAQGKVIKITNPSVAKEILIKENKRIKIKTVEGEKISGRFTIEDNNTLLIKNRRIELNDIEEIKRNPLLTSIFTSAFFIYAGGVTAGFGVLIGVFADSSAFLLTIPAAAMIYAGIKSPNFNRKFKKNNGWTYELIETSQ